MSISYSGIVGYGSGKATLPSVDTWGSNMQILRDPPKALYTRKIDHVGETSEITQMIQESGDRFGEAIQVYARGVNPMVAVSYDNSGNNGGQRSGGTISAGMLAGQRGNSGQQSYLPYRVMQNGAFRPPILDQRDLLPLSRLPRVWTSAFTQPGFTDFSKKAFLAGTDLNTQGVKKPQDTLHAYARPTAVYQIQTPVSESFEVKYVIKNPLHVSGFSGYEPKARFNGEMGEPVKQIIEEPLRVNAEANKGGRFRVDGENYIDTDKYTHEVLHGEFGTNVSRNIQTTSIDELYGVNTESRIKDINTISYTAPQTGYDRYESVHPDMELDRVLPQHEARTNNGLNIHKTLSETHREREYTRNLPQTSVLTNMGGTQMSRGGEISDREYRLKPTINPGGFEGVPTKPLEYQENRLVEFDVQKSQLRQTLYEMQQERNQTVNSIPYMVGA